LPVLNFIVRALANCAYIALNKLLAAKYLLAAVVITWISNRKTQVTSSFVFLNSFLYYCHSSGSKLAILPPLPPSVR